MMIRTKSIYDPREDSDGTRILITRFYPRGIRKSNFDMWWQELSPSKELVKKFKSGNISQEEFKDQFVLQIKSDKQTKDALKQLSSMAAQKTITILCFEKEGQEFCHRYVVKDWALGKRIKPASAYITYGNTGNKKGYYASSKAAAKKGTK